ncbi:MAG: hypothetical protein FWF56_01905 [Firmicutes bacterium]|nr:hypothetical protein [Bacillota bacterium]MCL1953540.1 hypothetical protein [Bacillota bacterium]
MIVYNVDVPKANIQDNDSKYIDISNIDMEIKIDGITLELPNIDNEIINLSNIQFETVSIVEFMQNGSDNMLN